MEQEKKDIKALIGLGNPGPKFVHTRHNIGFKVLDALVNTYAGSWQTKNNMELAELRINDKKVVLIKPQTFMNNSGEVIPFLNKQGIKAENILVVHDELEVPFGKVKSKFGGSAKGHNGLRSIISYCGLDFMRLRVGIGRPEHKEMVGDYVLQSFSELPGEVDALIDQAVVMIEQLV